MGLKASKEVFDLVFRRRWLYRFLNMMFLVFIFFFFLSITMLFYNINNYLEKTSQEVIFYAFIDNLLSEEDTYKLINKLNHWHEIKSIKLITQEEGLKLLKKSLGKDAEILKTLEKNPLPRTLEMVLHPDFVDKKSIQTVSRKLSTYKEISWFDSTERYIGSILQLRGLFKNIFIGSFIFLLIMVFLSFRISLRAIMYRYKEDFQLLKILGATNNFIILPFVFESFLESLISGFLASFITHYLTILLKENLAILNINLELLPFYYYVVFTLGLSSFSAISTFSLKNVREI